MFLQLLHREERELDAPFFIDIYRMQIKPRIAIFMYQPYCSVQSGNGVIEALEQQFNFKIFTRQPVEYNFFDDVDCVCFPGGVGDAQKFDFLLRHNKQRIVEYVQEGGKYLGICMGAYWADAHYFDILDRVSVRQYITQPNTDTRRPHAKNIDVVWNGSSEKMFFYDGPAFIGSNCEVVSQYKNGDAMAIIQNNIGLIGCHPEATPVWYEDHSWMKGKWTSQHHLLQQFATRLIG